MQNRPFRAFGRQHLQRMPQLSRFSDADRKAMDIVARVFPFRVNSFVVENLIDWEHAETDPVFQLVFPHRGMLSAIDFASIEQALAIGVDDRTIEGIAKTIRARLNPHPAGQLEYNVPEFRGRRLEGVQHKYRETVLIFPRHGQTCHAYCSFCFRWPQFVGETSVRLRLVKEAMAFDYIAEHKHVSDVLITGGDPLIMTSDRVNEIFSALLAPSLAHIRNIRIGTKALTYWPMRFTRNPDADALLRIFERAISAGKQVALMIHVNHWQELEHPETVTAIARLKSVGVVLRSQAPLLARINDSSKVWLQNWGRQLSLGIMPYYMFVERDTGAHRYFAVPLWRALRIYQDAIAEVTGLARTCRGPVMSTLNGKVQINGVSQLGDTSAFVLQYTQARDPRLCRDPFFAHYDRSATWLSDLRPISETHAKYFASHPVSLDDVDDESPRAMMQYPSRR